MKNKFFIIFSILATFAFSQLPQTNDIIGKYDFSGNSNDTSGNNFNATATGDPSLTIDRFGNSNSAYEFDGNDYFYTSNSMANQFTNTFTISAWIKSINNATVDILGLGNQDCSSNAGPVIRLGADLNFNRCNEGFNISNSNYHYDGQWHHYVFSYNGSQRKVHRDGVLINTLNKSNIFNISTYGLAIARAQMNLNGTFFSGTMDDVIIWNVALTDNEVTQLFNYNTNSAPTPEISQTKITLDNSTVSVTFSDNVYGGSANATSTLEVSDFSLTMSGGSASLTSATPSSINVSGTTIGLEIPLSGTPDGNEILTILPASNSSIFSVSGNPASTSQTSNTIQLISDIVTSGLMIYLDASNENSYSGSGSNWYDLTSNGNDGVISGTTFSSNGGEGFIFGGSSSDYITVADDTSLDMDNNQMTISYEITPDLNGSNWSPVIQKGVSATACSVGTLNYYTWYGNDDLKIDFIGNSDLRGQLYNATSNDILNGKKIMITITVDQSNAVKTYINGELKHTLNHSGQVLGSTTNGPLVIGYCPDPSGKISSIMIYDRALNGQEIFKNYDALNDIPPTDISLSSNTISETASIGSLIGTLSATDSDTFGSNLSFSFSSSGDTQDDDNGSFTISGTSLFTSSSLDYETKTSYNIYVKVSDGTTDFAKAFTVSVTDVNDAPVDLGFVDQSLNSNGLILYLDSRNTNSYSGSGSTWSDLSGNQNHFTVKGGMTYNSTNGFRFEANNTTKYAYKTSFDHPSTIYTDEFLLKTSTNNYGAFKFYGVSGNDNLSLLFHTNNIKLYANGQAVHIGVNINDGNWHHFVRTSNRSTGQEKVYLDGALAFTGNISNGSTIPQGGSLILGNESDATFNPTTNNGLAANNAFDGFIPIYRLYNKVLTAQEVSSNFSAMISNGNPKAVNSSGSSSSTASFDEGSAVGTVVATLTAIDSDTTNLTYSLVTGNGTNDQHNSLFTVSGTQLLVASSTISYDASTSLNINLGVSDGYTTISKAFQIAVNDLNRAPTDIGLTSNTITENVSPSTVIGTLSSVDLDTTDTTSFTFASSGNTDDDDNGSFTISGTSLILNSSPDYETKASYNIYINVNDGANNYAKAFTVSVTNVLEPITDLSFAGADFVTDGLILHLDAGNSNSYPGSGNTWFDLSGNNNHATINGPTFSNSQIKHFVFDGSNDDIASMNLSSYTNLTIEVWYYDNRTPGQYDLLTYNGNSGSYTFTNNNFRTDGNGMGAANFNGASQISNQWVRFVYVKNSKVFINDTPTNKSSGSDNAYGQLKIGDARSDVGQHWDGKIALVRVYNRGLTDQEISKNYDGFNAVINNNQTSSGSSSSTSVDEEVVIGTQLGTLTATDSDTTSFTFSLVSGNGTNDQHNSLFTVSGTQLLVAGNIDYETNSTLNIYVQASDGANTYAKALTVNVNDINEPPVISATTLSNDNSSINVTFSEAVYSTNGGSGALEVSDFALSINGGTATLSSTTPSSISVNGNTYTLGLTLSGSINGSETVTVVPIINAIYDTGASTASTTQTNNTVSLHGDSDSDGVNDVLDQCPNTPGGASVDANGCAESQKDPDNDGITGINDNCPNTANSNQIDTDGDGLGDVCDPDIDGDGIVNASDNCPSDYNPDQKNNDNDNQGDLCDLDDDNDGYNDLNDFFPFDPLEWLDTDSDGIGNNADTDDDNDDFIDTDDAFPLNPREWADNDKDGIGDNKDPDDDNDGVEDKNDAFPMDDSEHLDTDKDGIGNNADEDDDGDGYMDQDEIACDSDPLKRFSKPRDYDRDLIPDCIDTDDDDDGCLDQDDVFPFNETECKDADGDGIGDNSDMDADNDGVYDYDDDFPLDPNESKDSDGDGIGDNTDQDDNNDGFPEDPIINSSGEEVIPIFVSELLTPNQSSEESKWRIVNIDKYPTANVKVYSPSGIIVYESWEYRNDWSGTDKKGKPLPSGPYYYRIDRGNETTVEDGWLYIFN